MGEGGDTVIYARKFDISFFIFLGSGDHQFNCLQNGVGMAACAFSRLRKKENFLKSRKKSQKSRSLININKLIVAIS